MGNRPLQFSNQQNRLDKSKINNTYSAIFICLLVGTFYFYEYFLRVMPSVLSPDLMKQFKINNTGIGVLSSTFYITYMLAQIPVGILIDRMGARITLTIACLFCAIGTYQFALTDKLYLSMIGRGLVGFGSAFAFVGFLKISAAWLPKKFYGFMVGLCMFLGTTGAIAGEKLLIIILEKYDWQLVVKFTGHIGIALAVVLWIYIRNNPKKYSNQQHSSTNLSDILFHLKQSIKNQKIWLLGLIGMCTYVSLSAYAEMWAIPFFKQIGYDTHQASTVSSLVFWGFGIGGPVWGAIAVKINNNFKLIRIGSLFSLLIFVAIIYNPHMPKNYFYAANLLLGFFSSVEILVFSEANLTSNQQTNATTTALVNMIIMLGGIILQPLIGFILDWDSSDLMFNTKVAMTILASCYLLALALSFKTKN